MGFQQGEAMIGKQIDYVFLGSCTSRIEDFRAFASIVKGDKSRKRYSMVPDRMLWKHK
jgi:3-isopropylmalate/(R)-2-methylmalate dehydratase large subunit